MSAIQTGVGTLDDVALAELAASLADASVVGIGESTRFARETFAVRDQLTRILLARHGFRTLAVQDSADVGAALDRYVCGGDGTAASALADAWRPWRTAEMAAALDWIREFNRDHPADPVRVLGLKPIPAKPADYDAVLAAVGERAPQLCAALHEHLDVIRSAHVVDEHVQRARGDYAGVPFAEHARAALTLVRSVPDLPAADLWRMDLIVEFHERSVAGRGNYAGEAEAWAASILEQHGRTGQAVVYWDGISHTAATAATFGLAAERGAQPTVGSVLRGHFGPGYRSVAVGFHHGDLGVVDIPDPAPDLIDAMLGASGLPEQWVDLRTSPGRERLAGPAKLRTISGVYDPARAAAEHLAVASLPDAFDVLIQIRQASPVRWLT